MGPIQTRGVGKNTMVKKLNDSKSQDGECLLLNQRRLGDVGQWEQDGRTMSWVAEGVLCYRMTEQRSMNGGALLRRRWGWGRQRVLD